jgi:8-oxo-dGTP pyrophosphatase MutT (NUDIX family)
LPYASFSREEETVALRRFQTFVEQTPTCFDRSEGTGHVTGSALIVDKTLDRVLLTLHRKLNKWLQLGGHCDGDPHVEATALKEAEEESGLTGLEFFSSSVFSVGTTFDLDVHLIPARKEEPAHFHYDVRFLVIANDPPQIKISEESQDLRWFSLEEALSLTQERSMQRQFEKVRFLATILSMG